MRSHPFFALPRLLGAVLLAALVSGAAAAPRGDGPVRGAAKRPNVILVMTDDQGYGDLASHGNPVLRTPNLDRLRGESVRLTNYHVDPTCSPTRAALMTGRYSIRTGVWHTIMGRSILRRDEVTVAELFRAAGYRTAIFGKWHLGDNYPSRPQDKGFEEVLIHGGGGIGQTPDYWGNDYFDDVYRHNGRLERFDGYCTDVWFREAMRFIRESVAKTSGTDAGKERGRPFFLYMPTNAAHGPYNVPQRYIDMYSGKPGVPNARFYGMITNIDENMGKLMAELDELGIASDTILIFTTDNGTAAGFRRGAGFNAGMRGTKGSEYDGGHRVPFFMRWPAGGIGGGRDVGQLAAHVDVLPTLAELCGLGLPPRPLDGRSLVPLLRGGAAGWPARALIVNSQRIEHPRKWRKSAVMTDRWRLVNRVELHDIRSDPSQSRNLAADHPAVVFNLRAAYERWWADVSSRFDEYCTIVLGSPEENPSLLTAHDWHGGAPPWDQRHILAGRIADGFWAVEVERAGEYEIALRRWPPESGLAIAAAPEGGTVIDPVRARIEIAGVSREQEVPAGAADVTFRLSLPQGETRLRTWFLLADGRSLGAYYAVVRRVGTAR